jgi:plastocyanin
MVVAAAITIGMVAGPALVAPAGAAPVGARVTIKNFLFNPATVSIARGTKVVWVNKGPSSHTTTSDTGLWDSGTMAVGVKFSRTFRKAGTFTYHCNIHPTMTGTVSVT